MHKASGLIPAQLKRGDAPSQHLMEARDRSPKSPQLHSVLEVSVGTGKEEKERGKLGRGGGGGGGGRNKIAITAIIVIITVTVCHQQEFSNFIIILWA